MASRLQEATEKGMKTRKETEVKIEKGSQNILIQKISNFTNRQDYRPRTVVRRDYLLKQYHLEFLYQ